MPRPPLQSLDDTHSCVWLRLGKGRGVSYPRRAVCRRAVCHPPRQPRLRQFLALAPGKASGLDDSPHSGVPATPVTLDVRHRIVCRAHPSPLIVEEWCGTVGGQLAKLVQPLPLRGVSHSGHSASHSEVSATPVTRSCSPIATATPGCQPLRSLADRDGDTGVSATPVTRSIIGPAVRCPRRQVPGVYSNGKQMDRWGVCIKIKTRWGLESADATYPGWRAARLPWALASNPVGVPEGRKLKPNRLHNKRPPTPGCQPLRGVSQPLRGVSHSGQRAARLPWALASNPVGVPEGRKLKPNRLHNKRPPTPGCQPLRGVSHSGHSATPVTRPLRSLGHSGHSGTPNLVPGGVILDGPNMHIKEHENEYGPHGYLTLELEDQQLVELVHDASGTLLSEKELSQFS